jgi:hypothetical protein
MNCKVARRKLLSMVRPDQAPDEIRAHLSWCSDCREWHRRLVRMEKNIQRIPVPRSHKSTKQSFMDSFLADAKPPAATPAFPVLTHDTIPPLRVGHAAPPSKTRRWITGLAAGVVFGIGWWIMRL